MAFERGGRTDKMGNRYERRYMVSLMVKVLQGGLRSVQCEPTGERESGTDILVEFPDGRKEYHQCKARNGNSEHWTLSTMAKHDIFHHIQEHVTEQNRYVFVTALPFTKLSDLCLAARNAESCQSFLRDQLTAQTRKDLFQSWKEQFGLGETEEEREKAVFYLRQFDLYVVSDDVATEDQWKYVLGSMFTGERDDIYDALLNLSENDNLGKILTAQELLRYLEQRGHRSRNLAEDRNIPRQLNRLNARFAENFRPIEGKLFIPAETHMILQAIQEGENVLLLGEAGVGKSGCIQAVRTNLEAQHIPYLALSMDKNMPRDTPEQYGASLGLTASPVDCLESQLAEGQQGVLLMDQLDTLRWATQSCEEALTVCREMVKQAQFSEGSRKSRIRVVLVIRKFDYENDPELHNLCDSENPEVVPAWKKIELHAWNAEQVETIVGNERYAHMLPAMKRVLQMPCYLMVWQALDESQKDNLFSTPADLMENWLDQIYRHKGDISRDTIDRFWEKMLTMVQTDFCVPQKAFTGGLKSVMDFLVSENVLCRRDGSVAFVHQGMADYLNVSNWLCATQRREKIEDLLPPFREQEPAYRLRLQMFWQQLLSQPRCFLEQAESFLASEKVHYYYKCTVWEVLGQVNTPSPDIFAFVKAYWNDENWKSIILHNVFWKHIAFIRQYIANGFAYSWMEPTALWLLRSVAKEEQSFVRKALAPYIGKNQEDDQAILNVFWLCPEPERETIDLCFQILKKHPVLTRNFYGYKLLVQIWPEKAVEFLVLKLQQMQQEGDYVEPEFMQLSETVPRTVLKVLCPCVIEASRNNGEAWRAFDRQYTGKRCYVKLVQDALLQLVQQDLPYVESFVEGHMQTTSPLETEWILQALLLMPEQDEKLVFRWLMEQFPKHFLDETSAEKEMTTGAEKLLKKFSPYWSDEDFFHMEENIYHYCDPDMLEQAKYRYQYKTYWPYWGGLQERLLPALDPTRSKSKALQVVLQHRREQGLGDVWYKKSGLIECYTVHSSIADHAEKLSDAAWVRLITIGGKSMRWKGLESSPRAFAGTLETVLTESPLRITNIALNLPEQIDAHYAATILNVLTKANVFDQIEFGMINEIAEKFTRQPVPEMDYNLTSAFCGLIAKHPIAPWAEEIFYRLQLMAIEHENPKEGTYNVTMASDPKNHSCQSLRDNALNSTRGYAFRAIAEVVWERTENVELWKPVLEKGIHDPHPSVRYAVVEALAAYSRMDNVFSYEGYWTVLQQDIRILEHQTSGWFMMNLFPNYPEKCLTYLIQAFEYCEEERDLVHNAACILTELYIEENENVKHYLANRQCLPEQTSGIFDQCFYHLKEDSENLGAKKLLLCTLQNCTEIPQHIMWQYINETKEYDLDILRIFVERCTSQTACILIRFFLQSGKKLGNTLWDILYEFCVRACMDTDHGAELTMTDFYKLPFCLMETAITPEQRKNSLEVFDRLFQVNAVSMEDFLKEACQ